jgi:hypothetical protein
MNAVEKIEPQPRAVAAVTPMDMLQRAVESGAGLEMVEKLMSLQERWETGQARKAFDKAIAAAKAKITPIQRNAKGHNDKRYADFAAIAKVVDPILSEHGLSYRFRTAQSDRISVTCILSHQDGHSEETTLSGPADASGSKNAIQAIGSTLTYLQRYSLVQMLGLAASNDDDGKAGAGLPLITQEQADSIRELLEANGKSREKFLKWQKIERIEDLRADLYEAAVNGINAPVSK